MWEVYKIKSGVPARHDLVCNFNLLEISQNSEAENSGAENFEKDLKKLMLLSKESLAQNAPDKYCAGTRVLNKFVIAAIILSQPAIEFITAEIQKYCEDLTIEGRRIEEIIANEILRYNLISGFDAVSYFADVNGYYRYEREK